MIAHSWADPPDKIKSGCDSRDHAAASIMGLGMDPRFDLSKAYWIIAAIAGVDPEKASVASAAWAKFVVDGDLSYQIDAREIPRSWSTGYVPLGRSSPYQPPSQPFNSNGVQQVYQLNASLVDWAFQLTQNTSLPDDSTLQQVRAGYPGFHNALKPPFVLEGDDLAADTFGSVTCSTPGPKTGSPIGHVGRALSPWATLRMPASAKLSSSSLKPAAPTRIVSWSCEPAVTTPFSLTTRPQLNSWLAKIPAAYPASLKHSTTFT